LPWRSLETRYINTLFKKGRKERKDVLDFSRSEIFGVDPDDDFASLDIDTSLINALSFPPDPWI
jgi:hypothetical protein